MKKKTVKIGHIVTVVADFELAKGVIASFRREYDLDVVREFFDDELPLNAENLCELDADECFVLNGNPVTMSEIEGELAELIDPDNTRDEMFVKELLKHLGER